MQAILDAGLRARACAPGLLISAVLAVAAMFLSEHYGGPATLFALLLGLALGFLAVEGKCVPGINLSSTAVLRVGVALLGLRITLDQVTAVGAATAGWVVVSVAITIVCGIALASMVGMSKRFGLLTGAAVAICGVSAALAIASVLPRTADSERDTSFTVMGVTALSTLAMIAYPAFASMLGLDPTAAGIFLGGTIHDVAQVVGAGYALSPATGDTATVVKLLRVAMLLPVVLAVAWMARRGHAGSRRPPLLPAFMIAFLVLVLVNSAGWASMDVKILATHVSRWCLLLAISAIGMKTSLKALTQMGPGPSLLMVAETVVLAALVCAVIVWIR